MTKEFEKLAFDYRQCHREVVELQSLLRTRTELNERDDILSFFKSRKHLSAYLALYNSAIVRYDLVAHEFPLFGDFVCDLVVGDSANGAFMFVEFENAADDSIFKKKKGKSTHEWSKRFEGAFSQVVDWFHAIEDMSPTAKFADRFGRRNIQKMALIVIGRSSHLASWEMDRLRWRQEHVTIATKPVYCKTFDQLCEEMSARLDLLPPAARAETKFGTVNTTVGMKVEVSGDVVRPSSQQAPETPPPTS